MAHSPVPGDGIDYVFSFFEAGHSRQAGRFDRDVRRPDVFAGIAARLNILPAAARTVLVTGSKGKGTCARLIAHYLQASGYRVGLVLTPEELEHRDRIRVDGEAISLADLQRHLGHLQPLLDATAHGGGPHYYHPPTAIFLLIALRHFVEMAVDFVVVEGGRGVRHDEIGQLAAAVGVVTSILPEHLTKLGPSMADLCSDKFSLIDRCQAVLCSDQAYRQAQAHGLPDGLTVLSPIDAPPAEGAPAWIAIADELALGVIDHFALPRPKRVDPARTSLCASSQRIDHTTSASLRQGESVFLDGAVTAACIDFRYLKSDNCRPDAIVLGMTRDKDVAGICETLAAHGYAEPYFFSPRSASGHVSAFSGTGLSMGTFDMEHGFDPLSAAAFLDIIRRHRRVYVIGVQVFLRVVRTTLGVRKLCGVMDGG